MKTIVLANAPINNGNRGCVALSYCAIYLIDKVLGKEPYKLYLTHSQQLEGDEKITVGNRTFFYENISLPDFFTIKGVIKSLLSVKSTLHSISILRHADYVLDIGQGDSFADIYGKIRFDYIDLIHKVAMLFKKPYVFLPQTIGPFKDNEIKKKANKSLKNSAFVMARDKASFSYLKDEIGDNGYFREFIDVAFFLPFEKIELDNNCQKVGINISSLLWNGGYTKDNQFDLKCDYQHLCRKTIEYFLHKEKTKVYLIPHVVLQERDVENDYEVAYDLWKEYSNPDLIIAPFALDPVEIKSFIAGLDFFIGARMHATIGSFSSGVPVVPLAYSRKFNGLFVETLSYPFIVDMRTTSDDEALEMIVDNYNNRRELKDKIQYSLNGVVKERKELLLGTLKELLS